MVLVWIRVGLCGDRGLREKTKTPSDPCGTTRRWAGKGPPSSHGRNRSHRNRSIDQNRTQEKQEASRTSSSTVLDPDIPLSTECFPMGLPRSFHGSRESSHPASDLLHGHGPLLSCPSRKGKECQDVWRVGRIASTPQTHTWDSRSIGSPLSCQVRKGGGHKSNQEKGYLVQGPSLYLQENNVVMEQPMHHTKTQKGGGRKKRMLIQR